jgi:hypothetical protein
MAVKIFKSIGLVLASLAVFMRAGPLMCIVIWIPLFGLFIISRFSKKVVFFTEWSWRHFVVTMVCGAGVFYLWLGIWMLSETAF